MPLINGHVCALSVRDNDFPGSDLIEITDEKLLDKLRSVNRRAMMDTKTLVVGQDVSMTSGIYSTEGKVVKVTPSGVEVRKGGGAIVHFDNDGNPMVWIDGEGTFEGGPWYITGTSEGEEMTAMDTKKLVVHDEINDGVRVDELPVGKKVQVRTREDKLYTFERREDSLYISGYGYSHLNPWKCRGIGCRSHLGGEVEKENFVRIGMYMEFRIDDAIWGEGRHVVITDIVVEITAV